MPYIDEEVERDVEDMLAKDVHKERYGHWIPIFENSADEQRGVAKDYQCSECRRITQDKTYSCGLDYDFCPHCGSKMTAGATKIENFRLYNCGVKILIPPKGLIKYNCEDKPKERVSVDGCLADEIEELWRKGIKTTGCCCGHGRELGFIEVTEDCIPMMEELGYAHYIYEPEFGGADRKDAFIPKSYGHNYKGYVSSYGSDKVWRCE